MSEKHNESSGVQTTGHLWDDDLADYTNPPPKWWLIGLTASALWVVVYWLIYPSVPISLAGDHWKGLNIFNGGQPWTAIRERIEDEKEIDAVRRPFEEKIKGMTPAAILADRELSEYISRSGKVLFGDNCSACHGQNGVGVKGRGIEGYMAPVLRDDDWLYGGTVDAIHESITGGRQGMMVPHKDTLSAKQIDDVAHFVLAMSEGRGEAAEAAPGKEVFMSAGCIACHGVDAKGIKAMGSANLTDKAWRFDGSLEGIKHTITYGVNSGDPKARVAVMPNFKAAGKLSDTDIKKLAVYVYRFGGGEVEVPVAVVETPVAEAVAE